MKRRNHLNVIKVQTVKKYPANINVQIALNIFLACNMCDKSFSVKSALHQHVESVHEGNGPFKCDICNKKFSAHLSMVQHIDEVHEGSNNTSEVIE